MDEGTTFDVNISTGRFTFSSVSSVDIAYGLTGGSGAGPRNLLLLGGIFTPLDTDDDGIQDSLDIDSDNDGITDNIEAQSSADYIAPTGDGVIADANNNGLDDVYEGTATGISAGGLGLEAVNTDGTDEVDYLDLDSDNDGISDADEAGHGVSQALIDASADTDGDGLKDAVEGGDVNDGFDVNDENVDILGEFNLADTNADVVAGRANATPLDVNYDWRADHPPLVDLNSAASVADTDLDFAATFTEGSGAIAVADLNAGVSDLSEDDIAELSITVAGVIDGASEIVTVNGVALPLDASATDTSTVVNGVPVTISYDVATGEITLVPTDGVTPLDDTALASVIAGINYENTSPTPATGDRILTFVATDARNTSSTPAVATITVELDDDASDWSISQSSGSVDEGNSTTYTVTLDNALLQNGETATVELNLADVDTNSTDYANFNASVVAAVSVYNAGTDPGSVTWDGTTLTFISDATGAMGDLNIVLATSIDSLVEGSEDYTISLASPASTTGETIGIDANANSVTTTINDIVAATDVAQWSINGPATSNEGTTAQYTLALSGVFGAGEVVTVDIDLTELDTNSSDYADLAAAITAAVAANPDVTFDATSGTVTYTAPSDGAAMADIIIDLDLNDDSLIEGDEDYSIDLSNAASTTGASVVVDATAASVTTTIVDFDQVTGGPDGPAEWLLTGDSTVVEGNSAGYTLELNGSYGAGDTVSVVIDLTDVDTTSADYSSFSGALMTAVATRADLTYDATTSTLTYTSPADGSAMVPLSFQLSIIDEGNLEGPEDYLVALSSPGSTTGITATLGANNSVTTTINDSQTVGGATAQWSVSGPAAADEGSTPQYTVSLTGVYQAGEVLTVDLGLTDIDTNSADYSSLVAAINTAVAGNSDTVFDAATGTLTYTAPSNGASMTDLIIDLLLTDDTLIEGPEDFSLDLTNPTSNTGLTVTIATAANSVTTTINDTQGPGGGADGPGEWSVTGPASGDEGSTPQYTVSLSGNFGSGEDASVEISLTDIDTGSSDYASLSAAVQTAVTAYSGDGAVTFDSATGTITFTAAADGDEMDDLLIDLMLIDDVLVEGAEDFSIDLANAGSATGGNVAVNAAADTVTTTINDTQGIGGPAEGPAQWSITGPAAGDEGGDVSYTLSLDGLFGAGTDASVDIDLTDIDTTSADHGSFLQAVQDAVNAYVGAGTLAFNQATGTITYTAASDGNAMTDLVIDLSLTDDTLVEGPENFSVNLSNSASSSGVATGIDVTADTVTTTINDTQGPGGGPDGPVEWSISGPASADEGDDASYSIVLAGAFGAGDDASVIVTLTDVDTNSTDYANPVTAVQTAVTAYTGPGAVTFDAATGTLTFTAVNDGDVMAALTVDLSLVDDLLLEGPEDYTCLLYTSPSPRD